MIPTDYQLIANQRITEMLVQEVTMTIHNLAVWVPEGVQRIDLLLGHGQRAVGRVQMFRRFEAPARVVVVRGYSYQQKTETPYFVLTHDREWLQRVRNVILVDYCEKHFCFRDQWKRNLKKPDDLVMVWEGQLSVCEPEKFRPEDFGLGIDFNACFSVTQYPHLDDVY